MIQKIKNIGHFFLSLLAIIFHGYPAKKLTVIGVTGTDGKTTTVNLIYHLLKKSGQKAGMISTVGAKINSDQLMTTGLHTTTPNPFLIQKLLRQMVKAGCQYAVIEVTSHALDQYRVLGCNFLVGVITNVSHEHLDYHKNIVNYLETKLRLLKTVRYAVINNDDQQLKIQISKIFAKGGSASGGKNTNPAFGRPRRPTAGKQNSKLREYISYGIDNKADFMATNDEQTVEGTKFDINYKGGKISGIKTKLIGQYNLSNILAAVSVAKILNLKDDLIKKAIAYFEPVKGRMEEVKLALPFKVFIDFGHTPQAFEVILPTVRNLTSGRIIHVFGATGKRDKSKRFKMGEISGKLADLVILTSEDTYGEDPQEIIKMVGSGVIKSGKKLNYDYWWELDRQQAINKAISLAKPGDTVIITGVGHQTTINQGDIEVPWSELEAVKKAVFNRHHEHIQQAQYKRSEGSFQKNKRFFSRLSRGQNNRGEND